MPSQPHTVAYILKVFPRLSETFILNEILELERQGIRVEIFSLKRPNDPRFHGDVAKLSAEIHYVPPAESSQLWKSLQRADEKTGLSRESLGRAFSQCLSNRSPHGLRPMLQALWISTMAIRKGVGHFHAHFATLATEVAMLAQELSGIGFSFTAHAKDIFHQDVDRKLVGEALRTARFTLTVTDHNVRRLLQMSNGNANTIRRIYNGIPLRDYPTKKELPTGSNLILAVGRLVEKKGFRYLLEACDWLKRNGQKFRCKIVGRGPQQEPLTRLCAELGLQDVVSFEGAQCHSTVLGLMEESSMLVLPCVVAQDGDQDALPTVLLEAMALSKPVVSTDLAGVTEIVVHERTGIIVPQHNGPLLGQAIDRLLSAPNQRTAMGCAGRERVEELFNLRNNVAALAELYRVAAAPVKSTAFKTNGGLSCESHTSVPIPVSRF